MLRGPKPTYARIRIETLDRHIGLQQALGRDDGVTALKRFARDAGIEINYERIQDAEKRYKAELERSQ